MYAMYANNEVEFANNWASEASPTLGCSIEISRDIYIAYYTSKSGICNS